MNRKNINLSVIIPVYNEELGLEKTIQEIKSALKKSSASHSEIISVNDGSTDKSLSVLKRLKKQKKINTLISHQTNKGYGAALKTGILQSRYPWIMIIDADSTYPTNSIPKLVKETQNFNMVVGARITKNVKIPLTRIVPKKIISIVANLLTGEKIPDINSGMRIFKKDLAFEFWHLLPNKFSFTTTITLASHLKKYDVKYIPINYHKRVGKSSIKASDFLYFITLIIRLVVYFNPLKFFFWPGIAFSATGAIWLLYTIITIHNITDSSLLLFLLGIQTSFFGLIADLIVKTRESHENEKKI